MAHGGFIPIADTEMDYITFGKGQKNLVIIPGLGDGLQTVRGTALPFAFLYRAYRRAFTVTVFSRRNALPDGFTTRHMARDLAFALTKLGIAKATILGISQGGMIAQWLAIDAPQCVERCILCVTAPKLSDESRRTVEQWLSWAAQGAYREIFIDTAERTYTEKKLRLYRPFYGLCAAVTRPKRLDRFIVQATACVTHDATHALSAIACPTLIIGGEKDAIVGAEGSYALAKAIPGATLTMYPAYSHGLYEEAPDFHKRILQFCAGESPVNKP